MKIISLGRIILYLYINDIIIIKDYVNEIV